MATQRFAPEKRDFWTFCWFVFPLRGRANGPLFRPMKNNVAGTWKTF
jgi:hypothetical protein